MKARGAQPSGWRLPVGALIALALIAPGCLGPPPPDRHGLQSLESGQFLMGAWLGEWPSARSSNIQELEEKIGVRLDLVDIYLDWATPVQNVSHAIDAVAAAGAVAVLTWEAQGITTTDILIGDRWLTLRDGRTVALETYVAEFATGICAATRATGQPVLLRMLHEMNGAWFAWGISHQDARGEYPNSDESYKAAWSKLHGAFASRCGDAVRFVWAVNHASVGEGASFMGPYPGDAQVDFVAIDGYNWGANAPWGWQSFETIFGPAYCALARETAKPILIAEIASTEKGGDKAQWIEEMYAGIAARERVRGFVWFHDEKYEAEIRGTMDWPADSSPGALEAYSQGARAFLGARASGQSTVMEDVPC